MYQGKVQWFSRSKGKDLARGNDIARERVRAKSNLTWNPFETVVEFAGTQTVNYHPSFDHVKLIYNEAEAAERTSLK